MSTRQVPGRGAAARADGASRAEQKARTRAAIIQATLRLSRDRGFSAISLRDVAREVGIVPTAFYRHFASVEDLGVALAEEGMRTARGVLREIRRQAPRDPDQAAALLAAQIAQNPELLRFVATERFTAPAEVRRIIAVETRMLEADLALDLAARSGPATPRAAAPSPTSSDPTTPSPTTPSPTTPDQSAPDTATPSPAAPGPTPGAVPAAARLLLASALSAVVALTSAEPDEDAAAGAMADEFSLLCATLRFR